MFTLLVLILLGTLGFIVVNYNNTQKHAQKVMESHSNIMASMKKRVDLVNKLMDVTKGYGDHEKLTYIAVAQAENSRPQTENLEKANTKIEVAVDNIAALARNYPELKADRAYQQLMSQLHHIEDELQNKRETYNHFVSIYNNSIASIPFVFVASSVGFKPAKFFDVSNSDSLENIKDFNINDGEALRGVLKQVSASTKTLAQGATKAGKDFVNNRLNKSVNQENNGPE